MQIKYYIDVTVKFCVMFHNDDVELGGFMTFFISMLPISDFQKC